MARADSMGLNVSHPAGVARMRIAEYVAIGTKLALSGSESVSKVMTQANHRAFETSRECPSGFCRYVAGRRSGVVRVKLKEFGPESAGFRARSHLARPTTQVPLIGSGVGFRVKANQMAIVGRT